MNIHIKGVEFPDKVEGVTVKDTDGNYSIYVNSLLCDEIKEKTYLHELKHIELMHFNDYNPVIFNEIEVICSLA